MSIPDIGFLRLRQVLQLVPVSRSTLYAWVAAGRFPKPVKLGLRASAWRVEDIRRHIAKHSPLPQFQFSRRRPA